MKTRNLFLSTLACASLLACSKDDDSSIQEVLSGDNYVAVNIVAPAGGTRALGDFETGTNEENAINSAIFFFFDANGNGCAKSTIPSLADGTINSPGSDLNVERISSAYLQLEDATNVPTSIVAVINPPAAVKALEGTYTPLSTLRSIYDECKTESGYTMSNSVFMNGNAIVDAKAITPDQVCATQADAAKKAVIIPIERVVAKVSATIKDDIKAEEDYIVNGTSLKLKTILKGWMPTTLNTSSYLIKRIDASWNLNWTWNSPANLRSYWANSYAPTEYAYYNYTAVEANSGVNAKDQYCLENTTGNTTKLIVAAQVVDEENKAVELMEWRGIKYTKTGLLNYITSFNDIQQYYTSPSKNTYVPLVSNDLQFVAGANSYTVIATLKDEVNVYTKNGDVYETADKSVVNGLLKSYGEIKYWNNGSSYFYVDIQHNGGTGEGSVGIVRNHSYKLAINSVKGLGTPVPDTTIDIIPAKPSDDESYISAEIRVLSWKVVSQTVDLE